MVGRTNPSVLPITHNHLHVAQPQSRDANVAKRVPTLAGVLHDQDAGPVADLAHQRAGARRLGAKAAIAGRAAHHA